MDPILCPEEFLIMARLDGVYTFLNFFSLCLCCLSACYRFLYVFAFWFYIIFNRWALIPIKTWVIRQGTLDKGEARGGSWLWGSWLSRYIMWIYSWNINSCILDTRLNRLINSDYTTAIKLMIFNGLDVLSNKPGRTNSVSSFGLL